MLLYANRSSDRHNVLVKLGQWDCSMLTILATDRVSGLELYRGIAVC